MFLARKVSRAKWQPTEGFAEGEIPADAVTADLRTQGNKLSFWQCFNGTKVEVEDVALALATVGNRVDKIDIVWISENDLRSDGQDWDVTKGNTRVTDLIWCHVDVAFLDFGRLGNVAYRILAAIEAGQIRRLTKKGVARLIAKAVRERRVELADLEEKVRTEVSKLLEDTEE